MSDEAKFICVKCGAPLRSPSSRYSACNKGGVHELVKRKEWNGVLKEITDEQTHIQTEENQTSSDEKSDDLAIREMPSEEKKADINEVRQKAMEYIPVEASDKPITKQKFLGLFDAAWNYANNKLTKVDDEADMKWLAEIWEFEKEEREAVLTSIYDILKEAAPDFLVWLNGQGYFMILGDAIVLITAFIPRIYKSGKGFYLHTKLKSGDYTLENGKLVPIRDINGSQK